MGTKQPLRERVHRWYLRQVVWPMEVLGTNVLLIYFVVLMILAIPFGYLRSRTYSKKPWLGWDDVFRVVNRWYLAACDVPISIKHWDHVPPPDQPAVYAVNHGSMVDGIALEVIADRPAATLTAPYRFFPWPFSFWLRKINSIQVARTAEEQRKYPEGLMHEQVVDAAVERLRGGESLIIFPEGHLEHAPHLSEFKTGAVRIALKAGVPLIPVSLRGDYATFPTDRPVMYPQRLTFTFHHVAHGLPTDKPALAHNRPLVQQWTDELAHKIAHGLEASYDEGLPECDCRVAFTELSKNHTQRSLRTTKKKRG